MKNYATDIVLSLTTGILLKQGGFGDMQDLCEHIAGHPIWTHELADKAFVQKLVDAVHAQHPQLKDVEEWKPGGEDLYAYLHGYVSRQVEKFGASLPIETANFERTESPMQSLERLISVVQRSGN